MRRWPLLLGTAACAAAALAACAKTDWGARLSAEPLYQRAQELRRSAPCSGLVPMEFGQTLPVPQAGRKGRLAVLFYPVETQPGKSTLVEPVMTGSFSLDGELSPECSKLAVRRPRELGPAVPPGASMEDYDRARAQAYASLPAAARLYFSGAAPGADDVKTLSAFLAAFRAAAEPPLLPAYYKLDPPFWEWLRKTAGDSIPKA